MEGMGHYRDQGTGEGILSMTRRLRHQALHATRKTVRFHWST